VNYVAATKTSLIGVPNRAANDEGETLPTLISRLGEDVMQLFDSQLALFKVEAKEEANAFARGAALLGVGAAIAMIGFALLNVALAFAASILFAQAQFSQPASYALGFVATGVFYIVVGTVVLLVIKNRLANQSVVPPRTIAELRKDKEWLKKEL
jgi:uncharacterized membrane protein YqjE